MFCWVLWEAIKSDLDEVYVFTDDEIIKSFVTKEYSWTKKCKVIERSAESATDVASTEFAMREFANKINSNYDIICLLQATSPLTTAYDINNVLTKITDERFDSALTVVNDKRFIWDKSGNPLNYDFNNRPRRQDFEGLLIENGAVYGTTKEQFKKSGVRIGGKIAVVPMPEDTLVELDEPKDWVVTEKLMESRLKKNKKIDAKIKALFLDVDGVFTSGKVAYGKDGELSKDFSFRDGMGLEILREALDIDVCIITGENSEIVAKRMEKLNIKECYLGVKDKFAILEKVLQEKEINKSEAAYIGDDVNDLVNMLSVGWSFAPLDAVDDVKSIADMLLTKKGGDEAIREVINFIIKYNSRSV